MRATLALASILAAGAVQADELTAPPSGALACSGCHGAGSDPALSLDGLEADTIAAALLDFRSGARDGTLMPRIARGFSDSELQEIAAWIAETSR